ncbi:MAG: Crp/Fnr family transcriptional regulator [Burkholderiales bacterium]
MCALPTPHAALQNRLLAALPSADFERLLPDLEPVAMPLDWTLNGTGDAAKYLYFLTSGIVCDVYLSASGQSTEFAITGREGAIGTAMYLGGEWSQGAAVVVSAGHAYRMKGQLLQSEFYRNSAAQRLLLRYTQTLLTQIAQTIVCNRHHSLEQQFCRWLLLVLDRLPSNKIDMTQELIGNMLGVRRESVTVAAAHLQNAGLIKYHRGHIVVLDRAGLEARACECYAVVKKECDRLLPNGCSSLPV